MPVLMENASTDRRKYQRIDTLYVVRCERAPSVQDNGLAAESVTKNVSAGGLLFESRMPFAIGDRLDMEIKFHGPDGGDERCSASGAVVRVERLDEWSYDIAVSFTEIDNIARWKLMKAVYNEQP
ncbi:MAG: PilZ domain-containing protein [Elusimicrobiales bacterium]